MEEKKRLVEDFQSKWKLQHNPFILASMFVGKTLNPNSALKTAY